MPIRDFLILFFLNIFYCSCSNKSHEEIKNNSSSGYGAPNLVTDSVNLSNSHVLDKPTGKSVAKPLNKVTAQVNGKKFVSVSYTINRFTIKKDTIYSLYATNGTDRIIINYKGTAAPGTYNLLENADAIFMDSASTLFNAVEGVIAFNDFNGSKRNISGWFYFIAKSNDKNKKPVMVTNGKLEDVEFFITQPTVNNSIQ